MDTFRPRRLCLRRERASYRGLVALVYGELLVQLSSLNVRVSCVQTVGRKVFFFRLGADIDRITSAN